MTERLVVDDILITLAERLTARRQRLAVAESCTGGLLAAACTERPGSSDWFDRGFVTYSNEAKIEVLDVPAELIETHGAVSAPVVAAMLAGTLGHSASDWAIAISGVAGPGGGSAEKPVGTVLIGWARRGHEPVTQRLLLPGDRAEIRRASVDSALERLVAKLV